MSHVWVYDWLNQTIQTSQMSLTHESIPIHRLSQPQVKSCFHQWPSIPNLMAGDWGSVKWVDDWSAHNWWTDIVAYIQFLGYFLRIKFYLSIYCDIKVRCYVDYEVLKYLHNPPAVTIWLKPRYLDKIFPNQVN